MKFAISIRAFEVGRRVRDPDYGPGRIVEVNECGDVKVAWDRHPGCDYFRLHHFSSQNEHGELLIRETAVPCGASIEGEG